jgi:hypothetical protein
VCRALGPGDHLDRFGDGVPIADNLIEPAKERTYSCVPGRARLPDSVDQDLNVVGLLC